MFYILMCRTPVCAMTSIHACGAAGSVVRRALHSKHIDEGGSTLRS